jgi:transcriptional regulator with XRE-family HTH domain
MRLQAARLLRGMNFAADVDRLLGLPLKTWKRYEKGEISPKRPVLVRFADALDVSLDALHARHDDFSRQNILGRKPVDQVILEAEPVPGTPEVDQVARPDSSPAGYFHESDERQPFKGKD